MRRFVVALMWTLAFYGLVTLGAIGTGIAFGVTPRPAALGWVALIGSLVLSGYTAERWSPLLAGLLIMASSSLLIRQMTDGLWSWEGLLVSGWLVLCSTLAVMLQGRVKAMDLLDRGAFALVIPSVRTAVFSESPLAKGGWMLVMAASLGALLIRHRRPRRRRPRQVEPVGGGPN